jgi:hypothetical protein
MGLGRQRVLVREKGCILDYILINTHTHPLIDGIIANGVASNPLIQMLSPVYEQETIGRGTRKKWGWARAWGGNGVGMRG